MSKFVCFVRHGITDANVEKRMLGKTDVPLNSDGETQAKRIVSPLRQWPWQGIITSNLLRARQTAEIIGKQLNIPIELEAGLQERDHGKLDGELIATINDNYPGFNYMTKAPGRETVVQFTKRVKTTTSSIVTSPWEHFIVVSHNGFLRTFSATHLDYNKPTWKHCEYLLATYKNQAWHKLDL